MLNVCHRIIAKPSPKSPQPADTELEITVTGHNARGPVRIHRTGELAFVRDGTAWHLDSWRLTVTRDGRGVPPAPRPSTTTGAP